MRLGPAASSVRRQHHVIAAPLSLRSRAAKPSASLTDSQSHLAHNLPDSVKTLNSIPAFKNSLKIIY